MAQSSAGIAATSQLSSIPRAPTRDVRRRHAPTSRHTEEAVTDFHRPDAVRVPEHVWERHRDVLLARDVGAMFRLAQQWAGASQQRLSAVTGVPQSRISALVNDRGGPVVSIDVLARIADGLDLSDPARMDLGLAPRQRESRQAPTLEGPDTSECSTPGTRQEAGEDPTQRRQALQLGASALITTALGGMDAEPYDRLARAVRARRSDEVDATHLEGMTREFFAREEHVPARMLSDALAQHVDLLAGLIPTGATESLRTRLTLAAAETAALAGWVAYDLHAPDRANAYWQAGLQAARQSGDGPATGLILAYVSYQACENGNHSHARRLLDEAARHLHGGEHATALAWVTARSAEEHAHLGSSSALPMLERAARLLSARPHTAGRVWAAFFDEARLGGITVAVHAALNEPDLDTTADAVLAQTRGDAKTRAVILGDLATAHLTRGDVDQACATGERALQATVAAHATLGRQRLDALVPALRATSSSSAGNLADQITAAA